MLEKMESNVVCFGTGDFKLFLEVFCFFVHETAQLCTDFIQDVRLSATRFDTLFVCEPGSEAAECLSRSYIPDTTSGGGNWTASFNSLN